MTAYEAAIRVELFGGIRHVHGENVVEVRSPKRSALLAILALHAGETVSTEVIAERLWAVAHAESARKNVQVLVSTIRSSTDVELIETRRGGYGLADGVLVDVVVFERMVRDGTRACSVGNLVVGERLLSHALRLWSGEPFGTHGHEQWALEDRRRLEHLRLSAHECWIRCRLDQGHRIGLVDLEPLRRLGSTASSWHQLEAMVLHREGRHTDALSACRAGTEGASGAQLAELRELERRILRHDPTLIPTTATDHSKHAAPPVPSHRMLGRCDQLEELLAALQRGHRLVSIVGVGGAGKTRLALELARSPLNSEVVWIDLVPVRGSSGLMRALARGVGIVGGGQDPFESLAQAIGLRAMLMVLDNFEHVVDAAGVIEELIERCPNVAVLVTSRTSLDLPNEHLITLAPFEIPEPSTCDEIEISSLDAVRLFLERSDEAGANLARDRQVLQAIAKICRAVDGLPLGIELAAARTTLLSPDQILARLDRRLDLLRRRTASAERHQSLRAVIDWSYQHLTSREKFVFRCVSAFVDGCSLGDLKHATEIDDEAELTRILDHLERSSLVVTHTDALARSRWNMLETIADFGRSKLTEHEEALQVQSRMLRRFGTLVAAADTYVPEADPARRVLVIERANVMNTIKWCCDHDGEQAARTYGALRSYFLRRGEYDEGNELARAVLAVPELPDAVRYRAEALAAYVAHFAGDSPRSAELFRRALSGIVQAQEKPLEALTRASYSEHLRLVGNFEAAIENVEKAISLAKSLDDDWLLGFALMLRGMIHADLEEGVGRTACYQEARTRFNRAGDEFWSVALDAQLASRALLHERNLDAFDQLQDAYRWMSGHGHLAQAAFIKSQVIRTLIELERWDRVLDEIDEAVEVIRRSGDALTLLFTLACVSYALSVTGDHEAAVEVSRECLELTKRASAPMFVEYPLCAIAKAWLDKGGRVEASVALRAIDRGKLVLSYRLDELVHEDIVRMANSLAEELDTTPLAWKASADDLERATEVLSMLPASTFNFGARSV